MTTINPQDVTTVIGAIVDESNKAPEAHEGVKPVLKINAAHQLFQRNFAPDLDYMMKDNLGLNEVTNKAWDDLNGVHGLMTQTLHMACLAGVVFRNREVLECCPDTRTVVGLLKLQNQDVKTLNEELKMIKAVHEGRTGNAAPEDIMLTFEIYERYSIWAARAENTINENGRKITELAVAAEAIHRKKAEALGLVQPAVVEGAVNE